MRTTIILDELRIGQIKPDPSYDRYLRLLRLDLATLLADPTVQLKERPCPGCGADDAPVAFIKEGLTFRGCEACFTVFVSPVMAQDTLDWLNEHGQSPPFRRELFAHTLAAQRAEHLHRSMIGWMGTTCDEHEVDTTDYCDFGSEDEAWHDAVMALAPFANKSFVSSVAEAGNTNGKGRYTPIARAVGPYSIISCFSALDKVSHPEALLDTMVERLKPGGVLFASTSTSSGLEFMLLGRDTPGFGALDRLTMFSVEALRTVMAERGLEVVELSTPGRLDVESLAAYLEEHPDARTIPFWGYLFSRKDKKFLAELQLFLQRNLLSSYARVAARKPA